MSAAIFNNNENLQKSATGKSIAVLPFVNMSADPENEYFSDGITEEIINALTKIQGLKVTSRTSSFAFKGIDQDIRRIGETLDVATILEGSVRKAGSRVRITAQLIKVDDGFHIWSKNFDRQMDDIFALQDEISLLIADQIRENFGHFDIQEHLINAPTNNIEAYQLYLKGRYNHLKWNREGITNGIRYYQQSIEQDPGFALPYFGIGYSYAMRASFGPEKDFIHAAETHLKQGFQIDNQSYLGYFSKGTLSFWAKWDFKSGQEHYLKAMALNPSFTEAEEGLAELYTATGDFEKALRHIRNILSLNPLSPNHYYSKGVVHYLMQDYPKAVESLEAALRIDPNFSFAIEKIQLCFIHLRQYDRLDQFLRQHPQAQQPGISRTLYRLMHPDENIEFDLSEAGSKAETLEGPLLIPWHLYLQVHLGHHELALDLLEEGVNNRTGQFVNFKNLPLLFPLHRYERFQQLVEATFPASVLPASEAEADSSSSTNSLLSRKEVEQYLAGISELLEKEQLYTDQSLGLKSLAGHLDIHPNKLSWLINEHLGKNFNEYINTYRLEAFKIKALDPVNSHLTLLGLAYESGFNSKTVFNAFFKKMECMTPREWVKKQQ